MSMLGSFKYARVEVERCFLLKEAPEDLGMDYVRIRDSYIEGTRMRVRRMERPDGAFLIGKLGQKYQVDGQSAYERMMTSMYLNEAEYERFAEMGGAVLVKRRYGYVFEGQTYSLDVYEGALEGLVTCDVEGESLEEVQALAVPSFAVREVTEDAAFSGYALAQMTRDGFLAWMEG